MKPSQSTLSIWSTQEKARRLSKKALALAILEDHEWHSSSELTDATGSWRVIGRLWEAKQDGYAIERRLVGPGVYEWRLIQ